MKIGINASFLRKPGTGIGQVTHNVLRTLISNTQYLIPNEYEFFVYCEETPILDFILPENFHVKVFLPFWKRDDVPRKYLWERMLARKAIEDECDVFLSLYQSATVFKNYQLPATSYKLSRHVMIVHDIIPRFFPEYRRTFIQTWYWKAVEEGIKRAHHIVAVSEYTKNDIIRELHISENNISVVSPDVAPQFHQRISPEAVSAVLEKYNLSTGYIYHGGGLEIRKNTETLLRAYATLVNSPSTSLSSSQSLRVEDRTEIPMLVISGKIFDTTNKLATDVKGLVKELHLEEKVKLLGFIPDEDLPALYRGALFFVYPSLYEGFGLPVLEALCQGIPVLASNNSSLPEVGGGAALYINPVDMEALAGQMERLLTDETLRATLVSHSAAQTAKFRFESFVEKILATLKK